MSRSRSSLFLVVALAAAACGKRDATPTAPSNTAAGSGSAVAAAGGHGHEKWQIVSDWIAPDRALLRPIIEASSTKYAAEKGIAIRDCAKEAAADRSAAAAPAPAAAHP